MKRILFNLKLSRLFYVIICVCNVVLPWERNVIFKVNIFTVLIVGFWTYGLLSHLGYFLQPVSEDENGKMIFEVNIPIVQIGIIRLVHVLYLFFLKDNVDWRVIFALIALDVFYIIFIMLDKANYYYESEDLEDES